MKKIFQGNKAIARGAFEAGVKVATAYPGTPSTEIGERLQAIPPARLLASLPAPRYPRQRAAISRASSARCGPTGS